MFGKCLKWVFQVCLRRFPVGRDSLEVKKIIKVKFLWIIAATTGRSYDWVSVFLGKRRRDVFRGTLSLVVVPKWFHNGSLCSYLAKRWQSVSWYNLDKELNGIKGFLKKKQFFLYWIRNKAHFSEVLWLLQWVPFSAKDYYVLLLVLMVLNKFYYWFYWLWISS